MKKRVLAFTFLGMMLAGVTASCGSSKGHCDAYGNKSGSVEKVDDSQIPS